MVQETRLEIFILFIIYNLYRGKFYYNDWPKFIENDLPQIQTIDQLGYDHDTQLLIILTSAASRLYKPGFHTSIGFGAELSLSPLTNQTPSRPVTTTARVMQRFTRLLLHHQQQPSVPPSLSTSLQFLSSSSAAHFPYLHPHRHQQINNTRNFYYLSDSSMLF